MTQEQLRMQMLAGIITEGQYKTMLNEDSRTNNLIEFIDFSETNETDTGQRYSSSTDFELKLKGDDTIYTGTFNYSSLSDSINWSEEPSSNKIDIDELEDYITLSYFNRRG
jgi:hypothetical protein